MSALRVSFLFVLLASTLAVPLACSSTKNGGGGADGGVADGRGAGGAPSGAGGMNGGAGGRGGADAGTDARNDAGAGGAGGTIITVDAAGNTFTCADLLACCNSITNAQGKALCLAQYNQMMSQGNMACGNLLAQIKANGVCN